MNKQKSIEYFGDYSAKTVRYSNGITKIRFYDDNIAIIEVKKPYELKYHFFVKNDNYCALIYSGYMGQMYINLNTCIIVDYMDHNIEDRIRSFVEGNIFSWSNAYISADGNTIAVSGCHYTTHHRYKFFDLQTIQEELIELTFRDAYYYVCYEVQPQWIENIFILHRPFEYSIMDEEFTEISTVPPSRNTKYNEIFWATYEIPLIRRDSEMVTDKIMPYDFNENLQNWIISNGIILQEIRNNSKIYNTFNCLGYECVYSIDILNDMQYLDIELNKNKYCLNWDEENLKQIKIRSELPEDQATSILSILKKIEF